MTNEKAHKSKELHQMQGLFFHEQLVYCISEKAWNYLKSILNGLQFFQALV